MIDESVTPSPTFDFPSFNGDGSLDVSKAEDESSLISLDTQCDLITCDGQFREKGSTDSLSFDSHNAQMSLQSPLKPISQEDYHGFTIQGSNIPTIPCNTGELSLNTTDRDSDNYTSYYHSAKN